jgi:hypothetical protein
MMRFLAAMFASIVGVVIVAIAYILASRFPSRIGKSLGASALVAAAFVIGILVSPLTTRQDSSVVAEPAPAALASDVSSVCSQLKGTKVAPGGFGSLDSITTASRGRAVNSGAVVSASDAFLFSGWAADKDRAMPARAVCLELDGVVSDGAFVTYGISRGDVSAAFSTPALTPTGFALHFPASTLGRGGHSIGVAVINADGMPNTVGVLRVVGLKSN